MPHADASLVPARSVERWNYIHTKAEFWDHVYTQLESLIEGSQRHWVRSGIIPSCQRFGRYTYITQPFFDFEKISNLANASSLIYNSLLAFPSYFGSSNEKAVNWCGFYIDSALFPSPRYPTSYSAESPEDSNRLLLGPFCGKPACQFIPVAPGKARGVCAEAYTQRKTIVVPNVDLHPGHIACDGETKSEIVIPLMHKVEDKITVLGVLDLDCLAIGGFDEEDQKGLERIAQLVVLSCTW